MNFTQFIQLFPLLDPPLTLTEESIFAFSKKNKIINPETAELYLSKVEEDFNDDEDAEYIPCFRLQISDEFHSIVYWRASSLNYEYFLVTLNKKGERLDRKLIGGVIAKNERILRLVVSIDINYIFFVVASLTKDNLTSKATDAESYSLEILPDGSIISS